MVNITWDDEITEEKQAEVESTTNAVKDAPTVDVQWQDPPKKEVMEPPKTQGSFFDRITKLARNRKGEMSSAITNYGEGNIGLGSMLLQVVGKGGFGTAADIVGEAVATGVSTVVPDAVEEPIKQYAYEMLGEAYNSEIGQTLAEEWNKLDPNVQKNLQATGNIMAWAAPKIKASKGGQSLQNLGQAVKKGRMSNKLKLPETPKNKLAEAKRRFKDPHGFEDIVDEVSKVEKVSPNKSFKANINAVGDEVERLDRQLFKQLRQKSVDISDDLIDQKLDLELSNLLKNNQWIQSNSSIASAFDNNISALQKLIDKYPKTPQGMLRARREFDRMLKDNIFKVPEEELIARDAVSKVLRRALNDVVSEAAPYAPVKETLRKQSRLLSGLDNLAENYALEQPPLSDLKSVFQRYPMATAGVLAGTGAGAAVVTSPVILGGAALGATGVGAYRGLPAALRGTGRSLSAIGRATDVSQLSTNLDRLPLLRSAILYGNEEQEEVQQ